MPAAPAAELSNGPASGNAAWRPWASSPARRMPYRKPTAPSIQSDERNPTY
jgi:hypothetical protein